MISKVNVRKKYHAQMGIYSEGLKQVGMKVKDMLMLSR